MDSYIDIKLTPDAEMRENVLLNSIVMKLHKVLVKFSSRSIGVSFPRTQLTLGRHLRLHGDQAALNDLQHIDWLGGMKGYCHVSNISSIPDNVQYRTVFEKRLNMKSSKLSRLIDRKSIDDDGIKRYKAKMFSQGLDNPFLELVSSSNGNKYRKFIELGELTDKPTYGQFDTFGLSKQATVPWFE